MRKRGKTKIRVNGAQSGSNQYPGFLLKGTVAQYVGTEPTYFIVY